MTNTNGVEEVISKFPYRQDENLIKPVDYDSDTDRLIRIFSVPFNMTLAATARVTFAIAVGECDNAT
jgi:hypothetical protein